ncbi:hypothetical protein BN133_3880 [Cronobacter dublinensis 582]|nr:hypothetical protein BN133_3880 [Cronobacter dublinensis 582]
MADNVCDQALPVVAAGSAPLAGAIVTVVGATIVSETVASAESPALLLAW